MSQCDVVIVNYNTGRYLKDAVESTLLSPSVAHVFVIDNASTDGSLDFLQLQHDDRVTTIRNAVNLGFAAACNIGLARAASDSVLLLNPDCQVTEGAIERLIMSLRSTDRVGMVGPLLLSLDGSEQAGGRRKFPMPRVVIERTLASTWLGRYLSIHCALHLDPLPKEAIEVEAISGACMMVRRTAVAAVGPLDDRYFLHCEDLDWCMRFHQKSWTILFVPQAQVFHVKGVSSSHRPLSTEYHKHRGMIRFYFKFLNDTYPRWLIALVSVGVWLRFASVAFWRLMRRVG